MANRPLDAIINALVDAVHLIDQTQLTHFASRIRSSRSVFLAGMGRSGFTSRAFANRLGHLGFSAHFVGEPTAPPIAAGDSLILTSGSGMTGALVGFAETAIDVNADVLLITRAGADSPLRRMSTAVVEIPASRSSPIPGGSVNEQPGGTLFEQLAWLCCDAIVLLLRDQTNQTNDELLSRHANLE